MHYITCIGRARPPFAQTLIAVVQSGSWLGSRLELFYLHALITGLTACRNTGVKSRTGFRIQGGRVVEVVGAGKSFALTGVGGWWGQNGVHEYGYTLVSNCILLFQSLGSHGLVGGISCTPVVGPA